MAAVFFGALVRRSSVLVRILEQACRSIQLSRSPRAQHSTDRRCTIRRPGVVELEKGRRRLSAEEATKFAGIYKVGVAWLTCAGIEVADPEDDKVELAAKELAKLRPDDLDRVMDLLAAFRGRSK